MNTIIDRGDVPDHLLSVAELDFSSDLFNERVETPWFRLGACSISHRRETGIDDSLWRNSLLIPVDSFPYLFPQLGAMGNVLANLGKPQGIQIHSGEQSTYHYAPFHQFEIPFTSILGEPLVFVHNFVSGDLLFINPDVCLALELEERSPGCGTWYTPRNGEDVLLRRCIEQDTLQVVEIRSSFLLKYLQMRQMSLLIGHYRQLLLFDPTETAVKNYVKEEVSLGSPESGTKAILDNWGLREDVGSHPFLQRRLHLWFEIKPPEIAQDSPWIDEPSFDPYTFTLPTRRGPVAPARWRHLANIEGRSFEGETCDFGDIVYFRQEVLTKYEGSSGFSIDDNKSVSCHHYWGLVRSTMSIGNELLATFIGDFAECVPFEEWQHWKQYAVEPPSIERRQSFCEETSVPEAVNTLVQALQRLNGSFADLGLSLGVEDTDPLWTGSIDSLAGRQLKWVYPASADDDEFLKRATFVSTLVIDALTISSLRNHLQAVGTNMHMSTDNPPKPLGSLKLMQQLALVAILIQEIRPGIEQIPLLVEQAMARTRVNSNDQPLQDELRSLWQVVQGEFAPVIFLYDMRNVGGLVHEPNKVKASDAAARLGLPKQNWHRTDYLRLLDLITTCMHKVSSRFDTAAHILFRSSLP